MAAESITQLLHAARHGDPAATDALFTAVYAELHQLARAQRKRWRGNETMSATALVHEAFIRFDGQGGSDFANRTHFFATAAKAMRQILVNYAERQSAEKRGGNAAHVTLGEVGFGSEIGPGELLDLHRLLTRLEASSPRRLSVVECRIFAGMTIEEIAEALSVSAATVKREWRIASTQLYRELDSR